MQNPKKITPSFNKNKRTRQALFPHPNNENSRNASLQKGAPSTSTPAFNKRPRTLQNSSKPGKVQPMSNNNNNNNNRGQPWKGNPNNNNTAFFQSSFHGNTASTPYQNPWNNSPSSVPSPRQGFGGAYPSAVAATATPAAAAAAGPSSINNSWQTWAGVKTPGPPYRAPDPMRAPQGTRWMGQPSSIQPSPSHLWNPNWQQNSRPQPPIPPSKKTWSNHQPYQMPRGADKQQAAYSVDDRSLKVLTASIADMKNWSQHVDKIGSLMCEVFGRLHSAISSDVNGMAKMFTIKDEEQTLKCIFYETDRSLPRLTRDHWLRCMGSVDRRSGQFRCVSVRPASQAEQQVMKTLITASKDSMKERLVSTQEP